MLLPDVPSFNLTSKDIREGEPVHVRHTVDGSGVSPHLSWHGAPEETASYAVSCFDPDAPTPAGFWHWSVLNLRVSKTSVPRDFGNIDFPLPLGVVRARNDAGTLTYAGAAPPKGDHPHRYIFAVHALSTVLDAEDGIPCTPAALKMIFVTLARATITVTYQR